MPLAQYTDTFWFPNGSPAVNVAAVVFPRGSSIPATLYTDATGTTQLANPLPTSGTGVLSFWAESGEYWVHLDTESFRVSVGAPDTLNTFEAGSVAVSTGVVSGGRIALSANPVAVDIGETVGYVVDYSTDDFRPAITRVHTAAQTVPLDGAALLRDVTFWLLAANGTFVQQAFPPTNTQRRTHIELGFSVFTGVFVFLVETTPGILPQPENQFADLLIGLGPFSTSGNALSPNGVNLSINKSAGTMFSRAFNYQTTPNDPHTAPTPAQSPVTVRYSTQNTTIFPPYQTVLDPANYDVGGVVTPVPGGANASTIQRVFLFALDNAIDQVAVQYGQTVYPSLGAAAAAVGTTSFVTNPVFIGTLIGWIAMTRTATDLSNPAHATFIRPTSKFPIP